MRFQQVGDSTGTKSKDEAEIYCSLNAITVILASLSKLQNQ